MPKDYIPKGDSELLEFADNFISKIGGNEATYGLVLGDTAAATAMRDTFQTDYDDNLSKQIEAKTAREKKDLSRNPLVGKLREMAQRVQTYPGTNDVMRQDLQLTVKDTTQSSIGDPITRPVAEIKLTRRCAIRSPSTTKAAAAVKASPKVSKARKSSARSAARQLWTRTITDTSERTPLHLISPFTNPKTPDKKAHYLLRWVNPKNEPGAWSNPVSATITG